MRTYDQVVSKLLRRPGLKKEVERIEREEGEVLDQLLKARHGAGLTQAQVAERMGTQPPSDSPHIRSLKADDSQASRHLALTSGVGSQATCQNASTNQGEQHERKI